MLWHNPYLPTPPYMVQKSTNTLSFAELQKPGLQSKNKITWSRDQNNVTWSRVGVLFIIQAQVTW